MQGWCKPSRGAEYAGGVTIKTFRGMLKNGLRHIKLPNGRILVRYSWIDEYLERYEVVAKTGRIAEELIDSLQDVT